MHYDDVVMKRCELSGNKTKPKRQSRHKVYQFVVMGYRRQLCQRMRLPDKVKDILRAPAHESSWQKIDQLRQEVRNRLEGRVEVEIETPDDRTDLSSAVYRSIDTKYYDAIAEGSALAPVGSRVMVDQEGIQGFLSVPEKRGAIVDAVMRRRLGSTVSILMHAVESRVPPPMDDETREVLGFGNKEACAEELAKKWSKCPLTQEKYLDKLLLVLRA